MPLNQRRVWHAAFCYIDACHRRGVTPNLQKGKREILFAFRGQAPELSDTNTLDLTLLGECTSSRKTATEKLLWLDTISILVDLYITAEKLEQR